MDLKTNTQSMTIDTALLTQALTVKDRWHTFQGNGGCDIDSGELVRYVNERPDGVEVMPESSMAYRLDHRVGVVDQFGYLIGIELPLESVAVSMPVQATR